MNRTVYVLTGPTGVGKSALAMDWACRNNAVIIAADSVQVYRGYDIGSAKPSASDRQQVPHALIDVREWNEPYSAADYVHDADAAIAAAWADGRTALIVGGTGLYIRSLIFGLAQSPAVPVELRQALTDEAEQVGDDVMWGRLQIVDPASAARIHARDRMRVVRALEVYVHTGRTMSSWHDDHGMNQPRYDVRGVVLNCEREELWRRIAARTSRMLEAGLVDEVRSLLAVGHAPDCPAMMSIGYRQVVEWLELDGRDYAALSRSIAIVSRQYAKRQLTWFRGQTDFDWLEADSAARLPWL